MSLNIQIFPSAKGAEDVVRVALEGRLDQGTYKECETALEPVLAGPVRTLIFDLSKLQFISSVGVRTLITTQKTLAGRNGSLLLTNLQPQIEKVLEIIQALPGLSIFRNVQEMDEYLALMQRKVIEGDQK
jgi:anti-anti-sigma factor